MNIQNSDGEIAVINPRNVTVATLKRTGVEEWLVVVEFVNGTRQYIAKVNEREGRHFIGKLGEAIRANYHVRD